VFDAATLALLADIPAEYAPGKLSRVVGLVDLPGRRFAYSLFDADEIWIADLSATPAPRAPPVAQHRPPALRRAGHAQWPPLHRRACSAKTAWPWSTCGKQPKVRRILGGYGRGQEPLPVYKMPHLRGWAVAGRRAYLPAIGRHEVLVVDTDTWQEVGRIPVAGQPVFVMARPDGRQVWVNFAVPDYHRVQVIDTPASRVVRTLEPGKAVLHMEFTPRGEAVWISARDDHRVTVIDTQSFAEPQATMAIDAPSGIFFTARAPRGWGSRRTPQPPSVHR
jgi:protein NirF